MSFGIFTCCLSRPYTAMEKSSNTRLYAVHVQPLIVPEMIHWREAVILTLASFSLIRLENVWQFGKVNKKSSRAWCSIGRT